GFFCSPERAAHEGLECLRSGVPGSEVLSREVLARNLLQVRVHIRRTDITHFTVGVDVFEQVLPRQVEALPHHFSGTRVLHLDAVPDTVLATEAEAHDG